MPGARPGPPSAASGRTPGQGATARDARNRLVVRRVNAVSVLKVSVIFYFGVLVVMLVAGALLWNVAAALGIIDDLNKAIRTLFALSTFKLHPLVALGWTAVIGGALCFLGVVVNVFAAIMYNLISDIVGGVQVTVAADKHT
jgi:energy-converting hydrogenase Eha subunit A